MKIVVACDVCGVELDAAAAFTDADGRDLCAQHSLGFQLNDLRERRKTLQQWLNPHLEKLTELDTQIQRLEQLKRGQ